jgi:hypothetical protein
VARIAFSVIVIRGSAPCDSGLGQTYFTTFEQSFHHHTTCG